MQMLGSGASPFCQTDYSYFLELLPYQRALHCIVLLICLSVQWAGLSMANLDCALDGSTEVLSRGFLLYSLGWFGAIPGMLVACQHLEFRWRNRAIG